MTGTAVAQPHPRRTAAQVHQATAHPHPAAQAGRQHPGRSPATPSRPPANAAFDGRYRPIQHGPGNGQRSESTDLSKFREGTGKTVALRAAADGLDASRHTLVYLPNPQVGVRGIHGAIAQALGKAPCFYTSDLIPQVEAALAAEADERNRNVILAIDESHMLTGDQLEAVRMITNHNLDSGSPLTVLLIGQPTLRPVSTSRTATRR